MRNDWYRAWFDSPFYHKLYFNRDEKEAAQFISRLVNRLQPAAGSRILDVACGRGRHSRFLASQGFDVTGIDLSFQSIDYAKQFESSNLHFYQQDMRLPSWINYFDYAFNLYSSFGYFHTRRELDNAVRTIVQSLKQGGVVLFDYLNVRYVEDHLVHNEEIRIDSTLFEIHRWQDATHFYKRIIVKDDTLETPAEHTEKLAKLTLGDFTDMLSFQNVQVEGVFGDYALNGYDIRKAPRLILFGRKQ